jgi:hypothetical protein
LATQIFPEKLNSYAEQLDSRMTQEWKPQITPFPIDFEVNILRLLGLIVLNTRAFSEMHQLRYMKLPPEISPWVTDIFLQHVNSAHPVLLSIETLSEEVN